MVICKVVAYGRCSLTRSGRYERVDCSLTLKILLLIFEINFTLHIINSEIRNTLG